MYWLFENDKPVVKFEGPSSLAVWLLDNRDTHDYELVNDTFYLRFRSSWRLEKSGV